MKTMNISVTIRILAAAGLVLASSAHAQSEKQGEDLGSKAAKTLDFSSMFDGLKKFGSDMAKTVAPDELKKDGSTIADHTKKALGQTADDYVTLWGMLTGKIKPSDVPDKEAESGPAAAPTVDIREIIASAKNALSNNKADFPRIAIGVIDMSEEWKPMAAHEYSSPGLMAMQAAGNPVAPSKLGDGCIKVALVTWNSATTKEPPIVGQYCTKDLQVNKLPPYWETGDKYNKAAKRDVVFEKASPREIQYRNNNMVFGRSKGAFLLGALMDEILLREIDSVMKPWYRAYENTERIWLEAVLIKGGAYNNGY
jgi:hypothetical protein